MVSARRLGAIVKLRLRLLFRQKLGLGIFGALAGAALAGRIAAGLSWTWPAKVHWDFFLGINFSITSILALYLGSQLYHEERGRRTLHLTLAAGVSRTEWLVGHLFATWLLFVGAQAFGTIVAFFSATGMESVDPAPILLAQAALALEYLILISGALFASLWVRPLLAFLATGALTVFLHGVDSIERILSNEQYGRFVDAAGPGAALWISRALPPLHWFDLRDFVAYRLPEDPWLLAKLAALALVWSTLLTSAAAARFERMDL